MRGGRIISKSEKPDWRSLPKAGLILDAGSSAKYKTGGWRSERPVLDQEECTDCLQCWINCPDLSIRVQDGKMKGFDLDYCKGCGICASTCPLDAIEMHDEGEFEE